MQNITRKELTIVFIEGTSGLGKTSLIQKWVDQGWKAMDCDYESACTGADLRRAKLFRDFQNSTVGLAGVEDLPTRPEDLTGYIPTACKFEQKPLGSVESYAYHAMLAAYITQELSKRISYAKLGDRIVVDRTIYSDLLYNYVLAARSADECLDEEAFIKERVPTIVAEAMGSCEVYIENLLMRSLPKQVKIVVFTDSQVEGVARRMLTRGTRFDHVLLGTFGNPGYVRLQNAFFEEFVRHMGKIGFRENVLSIDCNGEVADSLLSQARVVYVPEMKQ